MSERGKQKNGIRKLSNGTYESVVELGRDSSGQRIREYVYGKNRNEVVSKRAALQNKPRGNLDVRTMTCEQLLKIWLDNYVKAHNKLATYRVRRVAVERVIQALPRPGGKPIALRSLAPMHVEQLCIELRSRGDGAASIKAAYDALRAALTYATRMDYIMQNVSERVMPPKVHKAAMKLLTSDELRRLLEAARNERLFALLVIASMTGARQGELFALKWSEVNWASQSVRILATLSENESGELIQSPTKTRNSERHVPLPAGAVEVLRAHYRAMGEPGPGEWVFPDSTGQPLRKSNFIRRFWHPLLKRAEVPQVKFHSLRHSCATTLTERGVPIEVISRLLGHADIRTTDRIYNHAKSDASHFLVLEATEKMLADYMADWGPIEPLSAEMKELVDVDSDGLSDVVEMRRLELLTPYMRSKCSTN